MSNSTWTEIDQITRLGLAQDYFSVGDAKEVELSDDPTQTSSLTVEIIGFNHDELPSGGYAGISFDLKYLMDEDVEMNPTDTTEGSYVSSALYNMLNTTIFELLPSDLKAVIKPVNKITGKGDGTLDTRVDSMKLWSLSHVEACGETENNNGVSHSEGTQYAIFSNRESRIRKKNSDGSGKPWWTRSPSIGKNGYAQIGGDGNGIYNAYASNTLGINFGFCV